jgi:hypothetical protein
MRRDASGGYRFLVGRLGPSFGLATIRTKLEVPTTGLRANQLPYSAPSGQRKENFPLREFSGSVAVGSLSQQSFACLNQWKTVRRATIGHVHSRR